MIPKDTILNTAISRWSDDDGCFVVQSALFPRVIGVGESIQEAKKIHRELLDEMYEALVNDRVVGYKTGRPQKPGIALNCKVQGETYKSVKALAEKHSISLGEALDVMAHFFDSRSAEKPAMPQAERILKRLKQLERRVTEQLGTYNANTKRSPRRTPHSKRP